MRLRRAAIGVVVELAVAYCGVLAWIYLNQRALEYSGGGKMFALSETALKGATLVSIPRALGRSWQDGVRHRSRAGR